METTGAVVMGRRAYAMGGPDSIADYYEFQVPIFVLTHQVPEKLPKENERLTFTFVTDGVESAIQKAKAVAGDKNVLVIGGASTGQQCIRAGLIDEIEIDIMPVLLGENGGLRLFERMDTGPIQLQKTGVTEYLTRTEIRFRVVKLSTHTNTTRGLVAKASVTVNASVAKVWDALTNPETIKQYMFGTNVVSGWKEGSPIVWKGEWQGEKYKDKGSILKLDPQHLIQYSHFSPLSGLPDAPENYHTVTIELSSEGTQTLVTLSQDNNASEQARKHSEKNWKMMLASLKKLLEK